MHNHNPLALVDRNGVVWPWDGREENEYLVGCGSRYIYDAEELRAAQAAFAATLAAQKRRRANGAPDPAVAPAKVKSPGSSKKVREAVLGPSSDPILDTLN